MPDVEIYVDPVCPFCWQTSKWLRQVQRRNGMEIGYRFISLRFLNEDRTGFYDELPAFYREAHAQGTRLLRVAAEVRQRHGNDAVGALYAAMGDRLWEVEPPAAPGFEGILEFQAQDPDIGAMLQAAGLDPTFAAHADRTDHDELLRVETADALRRAGEDVGTPILSFDPPDGPAFFGPVISELPSDEDAVAYYDALRLLSRWPGFAELKRSLRTLPDVGVMATMRAEEAAG